MKPLLLFIFLLTSLLSFGQAVPIRVLRIQDAVTAFDVNISKGTLVYEMAEGKLYIATTGVAGEETLTSIASSFELANGVPSKLQAADGDPAIAVYVDNGGNVGINDTSPDGKLEVNPDGVEDNGDEFIVAGNGSVGIGTAAPHAGTALEIKSTTRGILFPRTTIACISTPVTGLIIYNITDRCLSYYDGSNWKNIKTPIAPDGTEVVDIISLSGRTWMDRNLGAPRAATSSADYEAYGSLFQWCREADGHEQISWNSSTEGTPVNGMTNTLSETTSSNSLPYSNFITSNSNPNDWLSSQQTDGSLWWDGTTAGINTPCPVGYHVPTNAEWLVELGSLGFSDMAGAFASLKLPVAGYRNISGSLSNTGIGGYCWTSTVNNTNACLLCFDGSLADMLDSHRTAGCSVRCVKD